MPEKIIKLPSGYYEKDNQIYGSKNFRTNGTFYVSSYLTKTDPEGISQSEVTVNFDIGKPPNKTTSTATIPISDLNSPKVLKHIPDSFIMLGSDRKKQSFFTEAINNTIIDMIPEKRYVLNQGYNKISDRMMYAMGDTVINTDSQNYISDSPHKVKTHPKNKDCIKWLIRFSKMGDIFPALLIASIVPYIKPLLSESGIQGDTDFSVYIYGETSSGKTSVAKLLTDIFTESKNMVSLSSDKKAIYELSDFKDTSVLIDDLHKTDSCRVKNSNEEKLSKIIQQKSSGGEIKYKGKNAKIDSMIFITAEYPPKNHSTINRCLIAEMPEIDKKTLTWLQQNQNLYVEFILDFIEWICKNFNDLIFKVRYYKEIYKPDKDIDSDLYSGTKRAARMELVLNITLNLFLEFISGGEKIMDLNFKKFSYFQDSIDHCISETLDLTKKESNESSWDYVDVILDVFAYHSDALIARSYTEYKKSKKNPDGINDAFCCFDYNGPELFFREGDFCCASGDDLMQLFQSKDDFKYKCSKKAISEQLNNHGILVMYGGELSYPRRNQSKDKKRFYHLSLSVIKQLITERKDNFYSLNSWVFNVED